uniref:hypothetical protein n=1 Tax=Altererythrobacter segetis TaxID=1104773 RepID=UPI00140A5E6E|nr:hypothetical protein [Altererythrobacter segetis]
MSDSADFRDWSAGKRLFRLRAAGVDLGPEARARLDDILSRHPDWQFDGTERAEFSIWSGSFAGERGDTNALKGLSGSELLLQARAKAQADRHSFSGLWRNFTQENPGLAFEALKTQAQLGDIDNGEWQQLFFKLREETANRELDALVLKFLIDEDLSKFDQSFNAIVDWLKVKRASLETLPDGWTRVLSLWDEISNRLGQGRRDDESEAPNEIEDIMMAVLNSTSGALVELLIQKLIDLKLTRRAAMPEDIARRLEAAMIWPAHDDLIAQCALMQHLPWLEFIASKWTWSRLVPLLQESSPGWERRWEARFHHPSLGTQELFERTKGAFLATFRRFDQSSRTEGQSLLLVRAAFKATRRGSKWKFPSPEARDAVAAGGPGLMREITRILRYRANEDSAETHWRTVVRPILDFLWPRAANLQTRSTTRGLIQLMLDAGSSFPQAVDDFVQFVRPWDQDKPWEFEFLFDEEALSLLRRYPLHAITLLDAHVGDHGVPVKLNEILDGIEADNPEVAKSEKFGALRGLARRSAA